MVKHYEFVEHTADIAIRAFGDTVEEAFACAAEAMFEIITDEAKIQPVEAITVDAEGIDREALLVSFLSQLIVIHETDNYVLRDFNVTFTGPNQLRASASGELYDPNHHGGGTPIKGVSYHMLEIAEADGPTPASVQVLFDI